MGGNALQAVGRKEKKNLHALGTNEAVQSAGAFKSPTANLIN
jgi:hypothetical protein